MTPDSTLAVTKTCPKDGVPLSQRDIFIALVRNTHQVNLVDRAERRRQFERFGQLVGKMPLRQLRLPHDLTMLDDVRRAVLDDLAG